MLIVTRLYANLKTMNDQDKTLLYTILTAICFVLSFQVLVTNCCGMCSSKKATLPTRVSSSLHFKRKIQHFGSGLVLLAIDLSNVMTPRQEAAVVFFCACAFLAAIHLTPRKTFVSIFKDILRAEEASGKVYPATLWFLLGCVTLLLLFPTHPDIYRIALLHLSAGDPIAGIIGGLYGKTKIGIGNKSVEGSLACCIACSVVTYVYLIGTNNSVASASFSSNILFCMLCGIIGSISELIPAKLDDNITLPVFSGIGLWMLNDVVPFSV